MRGPPRVESGGAPLSRTGTLPRAPAAVCGLPRPPHAPPAHPLSRRTRLEPTPAARALPRLVVFFGCARARQSQHVEKEINNEESSGGKGDDGGALVRCGERRGSSAQDTPADCARRRRDAGVFWLSRTRPVVCFVITNTPPLPSVHGSEPERLPGWRSTTRKWWAQRAGKIKKNIKYQRVTTGPATRTHLSAP